MTASFGTLIESLDKKDMKNKEQYKRTILLSQRIQQKIDLLQKMHPEQKKHVINTNFNSNEKHQIIDNNKVSSSQQSPTETIIAYYDDGRSSKSTCSYYPLSYREAKQLPKVESTAGSRHSSLTTITEPSNNPTTKTLPSMPCEKSNNLYTCTNFDSAVVLSLPPRAPLPSLPPPPPPPPLNYTTRSLPVIQQVRKKYHGIRGIFTRTYQLNSIIVTKTLVSPYLYASKDKYTTEKKAVLKLILVVITDYEFTFAFPRHGHTQHSLQQQQLKVDDVVIRQNLAIWISYQPLLPLLVHAKQIFRDGFKIYVVYNHHPLL